MVAAFSLARGEAVRSLVMGYELSGKTALVTGANRGIGEAIVDALIWSGWPRRGPDVNLRNQT